MKKTSCGTPDHNTDNLFDPTTFTRAMIHAYEQVRPAMEEYVRNMSSRFSPRDLDPLNIQPVYQEFMEKMMANPEKFIELQSAFMQEWGRLLQESTKKLAGEKSEAIIAPDAGDKRFKADEWQSNAVFDFIKQSYLLTSKWIEKTVMTADLDAKKRDKLALGARLFSEAMSPTNFLMTNPEVLKKTLNSGGENLVKGFENLVKDLERGKISTTDYNAFELGKNIASTPGHVVHQNDLMQLIQYDATTDQVAKRPLLVIPPWINKYYILDMKPENSLVRWLVSQGHTVFIISWANPDTNLAQKRFEDYMHDGVIESLEKIRRITGEPEANVMGYCLGGTLLAITQAYLAAQDQAELIASATYLTTLLDFENSGDLRLFMDEEQLQMMDREMAEKGYFEARKLQQTFSLLRANDLIWSFVVNNYLMGKEPFPFDLLYWNDDSTNMPAAMHSFYLRKMYRDNLLTKAGGIKMNGVPIDLSKVKTPAYFLSTREDHIAPWQGTFDGIKLLSGPVTFTLAASGHVAGIVNPPAKNKYCYWETAKVPDNSEDFIEISTRHEGSWWPHWQSWIENYTNGKTDARAIANALEPAPGSYVKKKSDN